MGVSFFETLTPEPEAEKPKASNPKPETRSRRPQRQKQQYDLRTSLGFVEALIKILLGALL